MQTILAQLVVKNIMTNTSSKYYIDLNITFVNVLKFQVLKTLVKKTPTLKASVMY